MLVSICDQNGQNKSLPLAGLAFYAYQHPLRRPAMSNPTCTTIPLARPLHQRAADALADLWCAWQAARQRRRARRMAARELQAMRDMNELLLRDIGAPDWMVADASTRRIDRLRGLS
jgi:hypothetical protein